MEVKDIIAGNIAGLRKKKGLTQAELAEQLDYSDKAVSKWERGQSLPDAQTLFELATFFDVDANYLFTLHFFDPLAKEEEKKLRKRSSIIKIIYIASLCLIVVILVAILLCSIADIYDETAKIRVYLFILPGTAFLVLLLNLFFGHNKKMTLILTSVFTWALADALYFFIGHHLSIIFAIAAVVQVAIALFPRVSKKAFPKKRKL